MLKFKFLFTSIFIWLSLALPSITQARWQYITTPNFKIIFPTSLAREATRVANSLEDLYIPVSKSLAVSPKPLIVMLRNQTTYSNGFFKLMPRQLELLTFPSHDYTLSYNTDWLHLLLIHEFRHVAQDAKLRQNFNKFLHLLGGDILALMWRGSNIPRWFLEGDAVGIETALTQGGRGRIPYFSLLYKVSLLEKGGFDYPKQLLGSFREPIPDCYQMGYYLTTHLRRQYGTKVLADILEKTTAPRLFNQAVEIVTGKPLAEHYLNTNQELATLWTQQLHNLTITPVKQITLRGNQPIYTDYQYPQTWQDAIIVLKTGLSTVPQFVLINQQGQEKILLTPGNIYQPTGFSLAKDKMVWIAKVPDMFNQDIMYSVIQVYNLQNNKLETLTSKTRYASAALSPDAKQVVALETDLAYNHRLVILDAQSGKTLRCIPNPKNFYYLTPSFSSDGKYIIAIKLESQQSTLVSIHIETGHIQELIPPTTDNLRWPVMMGNQYIFYNNSYSGIDNIYALDLATLKTYQVTSRKYGAYYAHIPTNQSKILFNDFTKDGMNVVQIGLDPQAWIPLESVAIRRVNYYEPLIQQEYNPGLRKAIPTKQYSIRTYQPLAHLLDIHSWLPHCRFSFNNNPNVTSDWASIGFRLYGQNPLNTLFWQLNYTYTYGFHNQFSTLGTKVIYKGWYPKLTIDLDLEEWHSAMGLTADFPLTWKKGAYDHQLNLKVGGKLKLSNNSTKFNYQQTYTAFFKRSYPSSLRDLKPPWLQKLKFLCKHTTYSGTNNTTYGYTIKVTSNFPGFRQHHVLRLKANYSYNPEKIFTRHPRAFNQDMLVGGSAYYLFPIAYPDLSISSLVYIKRLSNGLFFKKDYAYSQDNLETAYTAKLTPCIQLGTQLIVDMHLINLPEMLQIKFLAWCEISYNEKQHMHMKADNTWSISKPKPKWSLSISYGIPQSASA
jgi:hypothetical protein